MIAVAAPTQGNISTDENDLSFSNTSVILRENGEVFYKISINKFLVGKGHTEEFQKLIDLGKREKPNYYTDWFVDYQSINDIANLIESGKAIRFSFYGHSKKEYNDALGIKYHLLDGIKSGSVGFMIDLDGISQEKLDRLFSSDSDCYLLRSHCFLAHYTAGDEAERIKTGKRRAHLFFFFENLQPWQIHNGFVKRFLYHVKIQLGLSLDEKIDSVCFDPTRVVYGSIPGSVFYKNLEAKLFTDLDIQECFDHLELPPALLSKKSEVTPHPGTTKATRKYQKFELYTAAFFKIFEDQGKDVTAIETWQVQGFDHSWRDRGINTDDLGDHYKYTGKDFRTYDVSANPSDSLGLSIFADQKRIKYFPAGRADENKGTYLDYLIDWYIMRNIQPDVSAKKAAQYKATSANFDRDAQKLLDEALNEFLELIGCTKADFYTLTKDLEVELNGKKINATQITAFSDLLGDHLLSFEPLESLNTANLYRVEETAKGVYKYKVNSDFIFCLYVSVFQGRIKKRMTDKGQVIFYLYVKHEKCNGYSWQIQSFDTMQSKINVFGVKLLKACDSLKSVHVFESMIDASRGWSSSILAASKCTLPQIDYDRYHDDRDYKPYTNGLYCLSTRSLVEYDPAIYTNYVLPYSFTPIEKSDIFDLYSRYIRSIIDPNLSAENQQEIYDFLVDMTFLTMVGRASELKTYIWYVAKANSGKSSFNSVWSRIISPFDEAPITFEYQEKIKGYEKRSRVTQTSPKRILESDRFNNDIFVHSYMVAMDDKRGLSPEQMEMLKGLTAGNCPVVTMEEKGGSKYPVTVKSLFTFTSEKDPSVSFVDEGGVNRMALIDFYSSPDSLALYNQLDSLLDEFESRQELDNYFMSNFNADEIVAKYRAMPNHKPNVLVRRQQQFKTDNDPVVQFIEQCLEFGQYDDQSDYYESSDSLSKIYQVFDENCTKFKQTKASISKKLAPKLQNLNGITYEQCRINGSKGRYYKGLRFKPWADLVPLFYASDDDLITLHHDFLRRKSKTAEISNSTDDNID